MERLCSPYWATVAVEVVKELLVKPQTTQLMADLLGMSVSEFLVLTQCHTVPWLILNKHIDVVGRISEARKDPEVFKICLDPLNLCPMLALLLVQNVTEPETYIMGLLRPVHPRFKEIDLAELIRCEPASTALCLLKAAGEADDSKKSRVCNPKK